MTDDEIQQKFDNAWTAIVEINHWRKDTMKYLVIAAFIVGGVYAEARYAIAQNSTVSDSRREAVEAIPKIRSNQEKLAEGVNYNGAVLREIAKKLDVEPPPRKTVLIDNGD